MVEAQANDSPASGRTPSPSFDVSRAFSFFFEDPEWAPKLAVGSLFALLGPFLIGSVFMVGYAVALAKQVRDDATPRLPEWNDFQEIFFDGLRGLAVTLAHKLPLYFLGIVMLFALLGGIFLGRSERSVEEFMFLGLPALFGGFVLVVVLSIAILFYAPAAFVRFVRKDSVAAAFDFVANVDFIRAHLSPYLFGLLAIVLAGLIAPFGLFFFCIGVFPAVFWSTCVMGYVVGELARLDAEKGDRE